MRRLLLLLSLTVIPACGGPLEEERPLASEESQALTYVTPKEGESCGIACRSYGETHGGSKKMTCKSVGTTATTSGTSPKRCACECSEGAVVGSAVVDEQATLPLAQKSGLLLR